MRDGYYTLARAVIQQAFADLPHPKICTACGARMEPPRISLMLRDRETSKNFIRSGRVTVWSHVAELDIDMLRSKVHQELIKTKRICGCTTLQRDKDCDWGTAW